MTNPDIRDFTRQELAGAIISLGEKGSGADRIFNCLYKKGAGSFEAMAGVAEALKGKTPGQVFSRACAVGGAPGVQNR